MKSIDSRSRICGLTNTAALPYRYGCVGLQIRVRESIKLGRTN